MAKQFKFFDNKNVARKSKEKLTQNLLTLARRRFDESVAMEQVDNVDTSKIAGVYVDKLLNIKEDLSDFIEFVGAPKSSNFGDTTSDKSKEYARAYAAMEKREFFDQIAYAFGTNKVETGTEFFNRIRRDHNIVTNKTINSMQNTLNWKSSMDAIYNTSNILKNGGHFINVDIESLSGQNSLGQSVLEHITEISASINEVVPGVDGNNKMFRRKRIDSVLGFDESQYEEAIKRLERIKSKGINSLEKGSTDAVFFDRMNIYAFSKTTGNEFEHNVTEALGIDDINRSIDNARQGIENLRKVGRSQEEWLRNNNISAPLNNYQRKYVADINNLLNTGTYEGKTYANYVVQGQNTGVFDFPHMGVFGGVDVNIPQGRHLDTYQVNMGISHVLGADSILPTGAIDSGKYGRLTQERLSSSMGYKISGKAAHIALTDAEEGGRMLVQPMFGDATKIAQEWEAGVYDVDNNSYFNFMAKQAEKANEILNNTQSTYTGTNQVYFMDYTQQKSFGSNDGGLSFIYDKAKSRYKTFDGFEVNDGATATGFNAFGGKRGALYTHDIITVDSTDELKNMFKDLNMSDEFYQKVANLNEISLIKSEEYMDRAELEKKMGKEAADYLYENRNIVYTIETNPERLGSNVGVQVFNIDKNGAIESINEPALEALGIKKVSKSGDNISIDSMSPQESVKHIKDMSLNRTVNDSAARQIRELDYKKIKKLMEFQELRTPDMPKPIAHHALQYAQAISQGTSLDFEIQNRLGYVDFKTGNPKIATETIKNAVVNESYVQEMLDVFNAIEDRLDNDTNFKITAKDTTSTEYKEQMMRRSYAFKKVYNDYLHQAEEAVKNKKAHYHTSSELNVIDMKTSEIFPSKYMSQLGTAGTESIDDVTTFNLGKDDELVNKFFNSRFTKYNKSDLNKNANPFWTALDDARTAFSQDERFKGLWSGIDIRELRANGKSVTEVNDMMMSQLRTFVNSQREDNASFGLLHDRNIQDVTDMDYVKQLAAYGKDANNLNSVLDASMESLKDVRLAGSNQESNINDLVNNYFMGYDEKDFYKAIDGFDEEQQRILKLQHSMNKKTAKNQAEELLKSIEGNESLSFMVTKSNNKPVLALNNNGKLTNVDMFRFTMNNGILTTSIGENEYINRLAFTTEGYNRGTFDNPLIATTTENARKRNSLSRNTSWARKRGDDEGEAIINTIKRMNKAIRNGTTRVDYDNGQLFAQAFMFDVNEMIGMMPHYQQKLEALGPKLNIPQASQDALKSMIDRIKESPSSFQAEGFSNLLPAELNHFMSYYYKGMMDIVKDDIQIFGDVDFKENIKVLDSIGDLTKTTSYRRGLMSLDNMYYMNPLARLDNQHRPPMTQQANAVLYSEEEIKNGLKNLGDIKVKNAPVVTSTLGEKFLYNNNANGRKAGTGLTMDYLQMDSYTLNNVFLDDRALGKDSAFSKYVAQAYGDYSQEEQTEIARKLYDRAGKLSTYEQQGVINSRVSDVTFNKINTQKINAKKQMLVEMDNDLQVIEYVKKAPKLDYSIKDGKIEYNPGVHVKRGEVLGVFGSTDYPVTETARYGGIFRGRFFDGHGNIVNQSDVNQLLKTFAGKNVTETQVEDLLRKHNINYKYEVMPIAEMHGMKVMLGPSEKLTTDSMKMAVGSLDPTIAKDIEKLKEATNVDYSHLLGNVTYGSYLDELKGVLPDELYKKILTERHALGDASQGIDKLKGKGFIGAAANKKHNTVTMVLETFLNDMYDNNQINEANMTKIFGVGNFEMLEDGRAKLLSSYRDVNLNFGDNKELQDTYDKAMAKIAKGEGSIHIVQTYDDISGTAAGLYDPNIKEKIMNNKRELERANRIQEINLDLKANKAKLLKEREELQQVIQSVDAKSKAGKQAMLDSFVKDNQVASQSISDIDKSLDALYLQKKMIYNQQIGIMNYKEWSSSNKDTSSYQEQLDSLYQWKKDIYQQQLDSDLEFNNEAYKETLRTDMKQAEIQIQELKNEWKASRDELYTNYKNGTNQALKEEMSNTDLKIAELTSTRKELIDGIKDNRLKYAGALDELNEEYVQNRLNHFEELDKSENSYKTNAIRSVNGKGRVSLDGNIDDIISDNDDYINKLKSDRVKLEADYERMNADKGIKFSNAMGKNLDSTTFNDDYIAKVRSQLGDEEFNKFFGYAMNGDKVSEDFLGQSVLSPVTDRFRSQILKKDGELTVDDIKGNKYLEQRYGYLSKAVEVAGGDGSAVSINNAEIMYSYTQGTKAMEFNAMSNNGQRKGIYNLTENKFGNFDVIGFGDLEIDREGQGNTIGQSKFNPYTNNLVIDTGIDDMKNGRYLAIGRMPEVHSNDSIQKKSHIAQLGQLQDLLTEYNMTDNENDRSDLKSMIDNKLTQIKKLQKADITSKEGLIKTGSEYRFDQSFMGKGSGMNINRFTKVNGEEIDLFGILGDKDRLAASGLSKEEVLSILKDKNVDFFNNAKFNGKSLVENYAMGVASDTVAVGKDVFETLGYFDDNYMKNVFDNMTDEYKDKLSKYDLSNEAGRKNAMTHLLSTEGDVFNTVRYPEIRNDSNKLANVYLDDTLKANEIRVMGYTGMSAKLDHDGDSFAANLIRYADGNSRLTANLTGASSKETVMMNKAIDASLMGRAVTSNRYWETEVKGHIMKEKGFAESVQRMEDVAGKKMINGKIYTGIFDEPTSLEELERLQTKYTDVLKIKGDDWKNMSNASIVESIVSASKGLEEDEAIKEYLKAWSYSDTKDMITAKVYQNAVGETNITSQKVKGLVSDLLTVDDKYEYNRTLLADLLYRAEEGAISSKTSVEGLEPERAKIWNNAITGVLTGDNIEENKRTMKTWLDDNVMKDAFIESYYARSSYFEGQVNEKYGISSMEQFYDLLESDKVAKSDIMNQVGDDFIRAIESVSDKDKMTDLLDTLKLGTSQSGANAKTARAPHFIKGANTNMETFMSGGRTLLGDAFASMEYTEKFVNDNLRSQAFRQGVEEIISDAADSTKRSTADTVTGIIEGVGDFAKSASGNKLAMGAVGIAAGIMVAGYVGGRPRPADVHAMEEAQDYQSPMEGYQLADPGLGAIQTQSGYVVNINARTNKGRDNAVEALRQVIASGGSGDINIAMNITDNYGNINDRAIEQAIMGAF